MSNYKQVGIRLQPEGAERVELETQRAGQAIDKMNNAAVAGADRAAAASKRTVDQLKLEAGAAIAAESALQRRINASLGIGAVNPVTQRHQNAESKVLDRSAAALLAVLEPARAAQDRLNMELGEYDVLLRKNKISVEQHAAAQAMARKRYDETTAALNRQGSGLSRNERASRLNLSRQASDVFVTAAMGMNPAMIAVQQGPQIMDAWATSGIKLSPVLLGLSAAAAGVAAAVGIMGLAYYDAEKATHAYQRAATGVGRVAGLSANDLRAAAEAGAEAGEISKKAAREIATTYVSTGKIGKEMVQGLTSITKDFASFIGKDVPEANGILAKSFSEPDKAAREFTRQFGLLDQETLKTIDSLTKQGDRLGAQKLLFDALKAAVSGHSDQVYGLAAVWDKALKSASDYMSRVGDWMTTSPEEHVANLERRAFSQGQGRSSNFGLSNDAAHADAYAKWFMASASLGIEDMVREGQAEREAAHMAAQEAEDRKDKPKKGPRGPSAEQRAREALARQRREEDVLAGQDMMIARANEDFGEIRRLEDEERIRNRIRTLIDDGTAAETARAQAVREQAPYLAARAEADERGRDALSRSAEIEVMRLTGQERSLAATARQEKLEKRVNEYRALGLGVTSEVREVMDDINGLTSEVVVTDHAILKARSDLLKIEEARAQVIRRANEDAERAHKLDLARLTGNRELYAYLDIEDRIERRAREIEGRNQLNRGEGRDQAMSEIQAELNAEATGARRDWIRGVLDDIRHGGIGDAIANQLDRATDHWMDKLAESLSELDWGSFLQSILGSLGGASSGGGGNFITDAFSALMGGVGGHANGTEYSDGGWKWVGENGRELIRVGRGAQVMDHNRSMMFAASQRQASGFSIGTLKVENYGRDEMTASARMTPEGDLELMLEPAVSKGIRKAGKSGDLARAYRQTPQTIKR